MNKFDLQITAVFQFFVLIILIGLSISINIYPIPLFSFLILSIIGLYTLGEVLE